MTPITINVQKTYNTGNYSSLRLGAEFSLDQGEDMEHAMRAAIVQLDAYFTASQAKPAQNPQNTAPAAAEQDNKQPEPKKEEPKPEPKAEVSKSTGQPKQDIQQYLQWIADAVNKYGGKFTANDGTVQTLTRELIDDLFTINEIDRPAVEFALSHLGLGKQTK